MKHDEQQLNQPTQLLTLKKILTLLNSSIVRLDLVG